MLKELNKILESQSPAQLAREFTDAHLESKLSGDELDSAVQNFLIKKGLRGMKMEMAKDKVKDFFGKKSEAAARKTQKAA